MAFPTSFPFERGANLWGQRSANATVVPSVSRKSTTGCSRKVRPRGVPPISSDHAAAYHAFRKYFAIFFRSEARRVGKSVSVRVDLGGRRIIQKKQTTL